MSDAEPTADDAREESLHPTVWPVVVLALVAAGVAGYLLASSLLGEGRPVGCGVGSGCDEVLSSRWSKVLGVPVAAAAVVVYVSVAVLAASWSRASSKDGKSRLSQGLWCAAGAVLTAVSWFVGLQGIELRVFCPWCLTDHALGTATAAAVLATQWRARQFRPFSFAAGVALAGALALVQIVLPSEARSAVALNPQQSRELEARLGDDLTEAPTLGVRSGGPSVAALFDYCCPHCRRTHALLLEVRSQSREPFSIVLLPTPLDADCNPTVEETEPRFADACELARLALAVWRASPSRFAEFDQWLFTPEQPRSAAEARAEAERLVGAEELQRALADPWVELRLRANVEAFGASGVDTLPVLLVPGRGGVSGRATSAEGLTELLRDELGVPLQ